MKAAVYCRVSTDSQEREGTSLQTQMEGCLDLCQRKGYEVTYKFSESYSGLLLERPYLDELRELIRKEQIDVIIIHSLDRLSRDPVHGVIITQELEKHHVTLEATTETVDTSELGKLITYIRGFNAKIEAEKIRERCGRGLLQRARNGKHPSGHRAKLYGTSYISGRGVGEGISVINDKEASIVRQIYQWCAEGETLNGVTYKLRALNVPTPSGKGFWNRATVYAILTNQRYIGRTFAFMSTRTEPKEPYKEVRKHKKTRRVFKPKDQWVEIQGCSPQIVSEDVFNLVQEKLQMNKAKAKRNAKIPYLLRGHIYCARCGRKYWGYAVYRQRKFTGETYYYCLGRRSMVTPNKCDNKGYNARQLEGMVWEQVERILTQPDIVIMGLKARQEEASQQELWQKQLDVIKNQLINREKQRDRIHKSFYITGNEDKFRQDIGALEQEVQTLKSSQAELENRIQTIISNTFDYDSVMAACELVRNNLTTLTFEQKRATLSALNVKVRINGDEVLLEGVIDLGTKVESSLPEWHRHNNQSQFPFVIALTSHDFVKE